VAPDLTDESQNGHTLLDLDGERQVLEMIALMEALCRAIDRRSGPALRLE
jgi:hypothetical protein